MDQSKKLRKELFFYKYIKRKHREQKMKWNRKMNDKDMMNIQLYTDFYKKERKWALVNE